MIEPGALLQSRYRVVKQIGQGGMGAVYVATDERFQSTVAIKQTFFDDPMLRKAFEREAHLLNHLRHVALPRVSDHFVEGEGQFLVMEYIEGDELAESLQQRGAFPLADVLRWADELLDALDYLHTHEPPIVHRDIKPQNMKLTPRGQIVLLDFGLAKGATTGTRAASATASVFGYSRNYAPLEQIQGTGTDTRSDLYSLGATLYHLLTGFAPVDGLTRAGAVINNQPDPLRPAHVAHAQVPESISKILHRAMALKAALRPATAAEMRTALRQAASVLARTTPQAAAARTHGQPARHEATVLDGGAQMFGGQQAVAGTLSPTRLRPPVSLTESEVTVVDSSNDLTRPSIKSYSHTSFHAPETPPARKHSPSVIIGVALAVLAACAFVAFPLLRSPAASPAASESQIEMQPAGAQSVAPGAGQTETTIQTLSPASGQTLSPSSDARALVGESRTPAGQLHSGETEGSGGSVGNADGSRHGSPAVEAPADKSGLVIQSPAPSSPTGVKNDAAAEYDAQRAEELRRRKQQQAQEEQRRRDQESFRPPHPPHHEGGYPPPGGGHRPPPHRPPFR
ncbi:MAG TPA: serine/threonine-protein kinase [Pyrinomonadaceae bacterium]|nr:serine/threonine-protein kinase [Pyrinomonadaceae bacterium]